MKKITYTMRGYVYGKFWGGGKGFYPSHTLIGSNKKTMLARAEKELQSLDSGMGYEKVLGALLYVTKDTEITIAGKLFTNRVFEDAEVVGELTEDEVNFILQLN